MTIPELEEALQKQQALFEKFAKDLSNTVENIKELRQQLDVPCSSSVNEMPPSIYDPLAATRR